jgi:uncharacterized protein with HEPN domain
MWRDDAYLLDILIAARRVLRYVGDLSWESFKEDEMAQDAVIRNLQIIGEAARKISDEFRSGHPEVPWGGIVGMRNRLVHELLPGRHREDLGNRRGRRPAAYPVDRVTGSP